MSAAHDARRTLLPLLLALTPGMILHALLVDPQLPLRLLLLAGVCVAAAAPRSMRAGHGLLDGSALITASVLAVALPPSLSPGLAALAGAFAMLVGRQALDGFNPAMLAYAVLAIFVPAQLYGPTDASSGATLLTTMSEALKQQQTLSEVYRTHALSPGLSSLPALAWLGGAAWLARHGRLAWRISVGMLVGLSICALLPWMLDTDRAASPLVHLASGGVLFAACFVATDPGAAPRAVRVQWLYGLGIGALLYALRRWGAYPDGIAFAVLLMNALAPGLERGFTRRPAARS